MNNELTTLSPHDFPPLLREIPDAPKKLYVRGTLPSTEGKWLAVVGSRAISPYGRQAVRHLLQGLRGYPIIIVSGLAFGMDAEAHKAALESGLTTVAIPGSGLDWDVLYPRANVALAREIVARGGALVSEFEPTMRAQLYTFPQRNRIMAGISHATLVVEAREKSGSLITARLTAEYNRELLVVPGSIFSAESRGTHQFLKLGATPVTESADILRALSLEVTQVRPVSERTDLSDNEQKVLNLLSQPCPHDVLIEKLNLPISETQMLFSAMEIKGLIEEKFGLIHAR
ncbi:MAG TPA: DNA-processing protein DprA [Candidatus Paceibacterota bacterium]